MKIQHILSNKTVNEGVLDDVRARMAASRNPTARPTSPASQPATAPVAADDGYKVGDIVDFGVGVPKPKVIQQGTITAIRRTPHGMMVYTVKTADGQTHELDTMMKSLYMMPTQAASTVAEAAADFDASKIDPDTKCKTCGTAFKNHFRFDDNGKITGTLVRHMTMKDDFPGMPGRDASAFFGTKPGMISRPTSGTSNLARPNPTPDLPRATKISQNKTTGETVISYNGKLFVLPDSPYVKSPEGVTGERVLVPAAAFGIRAMGDVIAILGNDGKAYAEQPMKVFNTYSTAKSQGVAEAYDPAAAAKIIGVATKAGIRIFYDKFTSDSNFSNEIDAEYGFKYTDIKITSIPTAIGFAKSAMAWLNARGAYLTYNPKAPVQFQLTMPNQAEPYDFNVMDVMERWKPYGANESALAGGNRVAKFDPVTGLPASGQISEFEGDVVNYPPTTGTPTQSTPTTQQPPRRGYSIHLIKKPGGNGANYEAKDAWLALSAVFPKDYPLAGPNNDGPAQHKVYEVVKNGSAVVKSGIGSEDIAETLVAKLVKFRVPYDCWEITSEDLNESVSNDLQFLLKSAGIVQNK
jgi:hypothetical protein